MIKDDVPVFDCVAHFIVRSPRQFAEWIGKLIFWCWEDKIIYGSETPIWHPIRSTSTPRTCSEMRASCSANTSLLSIMS